MAETHPNAYRQEAAEKRAQANILNGEADGLEARAEELDPTPKKVVKEKAPSKPKAKPKSTSKPKAKPKSTSKPKAKGADKAPTAPELPKDDDKK